MLASALTATFHDLQSDALQLNAVLGHAFHGCIHHHRVLLCLGDTFHCGQRGSQEEGD